MPGGAERLLAVLLDGSPVLFGVGLLAVLALDVRTHVVVPVLRAYGRRWAKRIEAPPTATKPPGAHHGRSRRVRLRGARGPGLTARRRASQDQEQQPARL